MKTFFDTSTLIGAMIEGHSAHALSLPWLQRVKAGTDIGLVAAHTVAELYAILTRLPVSPRISPAGALQLVASNVLDACEIVSLTADDYVTLLRHLAEQGVSGGATYDALLLHAAWKAGADRVVTLNVHDFRRVYPALADRIVSPSEG